MKNMQVYSGIAARIKQVVHTNEYAGHGDFVSPFANVSVHAHPALFPLLRSHIYYPSERDDAAPDWTISAVERADSWEMVIDLLEPRWEPVLDYGADGLVVDVDSAVRIVLSPTTRTVMVRDSGEKKIYVVGKDVRGLFAELYRAVRGIHTALATGDGALPFHCSSVSRNDQVVCFVGNKGAGKSTALLATATAHIDGLKILTNDKALLYPREGLQLLAWPSVVNAGAGSLLAVGGEKVLTPEFHYQYGAMAFLLLDLPLIEDISMEGGDAAPAKVRLLPEELRLALGVEFATEGPVVAIIQSELALENERSTLQLVVDPDARNEIVRQNILDDWSNHPDWLGIAPAEEKPAIALKIEVPQEVLIAKLLVGRDGKDVTRGLVVELTDLAKGAENTSDFETSPLPTYHFGVYARIISNGSLLCVRKSRGPYTGLLDLPGGRPEFAESWHDALRRELSEELGVSDIAVGDFKKIQVRVSQDTSGAQINFHHHGVVADVQLLQELPNIAEPSPDTEGFEWFDLENGDTTGLSTLAELAVQQE